jgi:hypothetical protein
MDEQPGPKTDSTEPTLIDEMRELGSAFSALGRTAFKSGRVVSVEVVRAIRGIVDRAREEIDRMAEKEKK